MDGSKLTSPWLNWAIELQSIAQCGLAYTPNIYDKERFERLREISAEMLAYQSDIPKEKVQEIFCSEKGYQTPKIDTRGAIIKDDKILLVKESTGKWTLPGGWMDVLQSVGSNTIKEVREEAGITAKTVKIIAVQDRKIHNSPNYIFAICKIFVLCEALGGEFKPNIETVDSGYFALDELPVLAEEKTNLEQVKMCFDAYYDENWQTRFD